LIQALLLKQKDANYPLNPNCIYDKTQSAIEAWKNVGHLPFLR